MRRVAAALLAVFLGACSEEPRTDGRAPVPGRTDALKSTASVRAERRLFDGAPPVIPHAPMGASCIQCHNQRGMDVPNVGFAPPSPHEETPGMSAVSRCPQCHVYRSTDELFVASTFDGLRQDLRRGTRFYTGAPPVIPHPIQMRENCSACHDGPAAREEVRCSHPTRARCTQCHVAPVESTRFVRS